jgi:hypothetical protein
MTHKDHKITVAQQSDLNWDGNVEEEEEEEEECPQSST